MCLETLEDRFLPSFVAPANYDIGFQPQAVVVGDFTGDGQPDLAVATLTGLSVLRGKGDGAFQPAQNYAVGGGLLDARALYPHLRVV